MKIRTGLYFSAILSVVLAGLLASIIFFTSKGIERADQEIALATNIQQSLSEMDKLAYSYSSEPKTKIAGQWRLRYNSMQGLIDETKDKPLLSSVRADYFLLGHLFSQLVFNYEQKENLVRSNAPQEKLVPLLSREKTLVSQIIIKSTSITTNTFRLAGDARTRLAGARLLGRNLTIMFVLLLGIVVFAAASLLSRYISKGIDKLKKGAKMIGKGNLDYKIEASGKQEFDSLAQSFNEMVKDLKETQSQLVQNEKMSAVGLLGAGAAHELNNPLAGVLGHLALLKRKWSADEDSFETLDMIERETKRCARIVDGLLSATGEGEKGMELEVDCNVILSTVLSVTRDQLEKENIRIIEKIDPNLPKIVAVPDQLQKVFLNMMLNAKDAVRDSKKKEITIITRAIPTGMEIVFRDSGAGIAEDRAHKIFDPFYTTKEVGQGTGLGLYVSSNFVKRHGGTIQVHNESGGGTSFIISLPRGVRNPKSATH